MIRFIDGHFYFLKFGSNFGGRPFVGRRMLCVEELIGVVVLFIFGVIGREPGGRCVFFFDGLKAGETGEK